MAVSLTVDIRDVRGNLWENENSASANEHRHHYVPKTHMCSNPPCGTPAQAKRSRPPPDRAFVGYLSRRANMRIAEAVPSMVGSRKVMLDSLPLLIRKLVSWHRAILQEQFIRPNLAQHHGSHEPWQDQFSDGA
jgi:hypothetical protein